MRRMALRGSRVDLGQNLKGRDSPLCGNSLRDELVGDPADVVITDEVHVSLVVLDHEDVFAEQNVIRGWDRICDICCDVHAEGVERHCPKKLFNLLSHNRILAHLRLLANDKFVGRSHGVGIFWTENQRDSVPCKGEHECLALGGQP